MASGRIKKSNQKLLATNYRIGIGITSYDDLFSNFDPRPFQERELSEDFLEELRRFFFRKSPDYLDVVLLMPASRRNRRLEETIKKRLHIAFQRKYRVTHKELKNATSWNAAKIAFALMIMVSTGYLAVYAGQVVWRNILKVMLEPASWFLFWTSIDDLITVRKAVRHDLAYYHQLSECKIVFVSA